MKKSVMFLTLAAMVALALPALGQEQEWATMHYVGYAWEDGGIPPSNYLDIFYFVGSATEADAAYDVDLTVDELTFYIYDLVSWGQQDVGGGVLVIEYDGGMLDIWRDSQMNATYGVNPPNGTVPSTFTDGNLFFRGPFTEMTLVLYPDGTGEFAGTLNGHEGELIEEACYGCVVTFAGVFEEGQIPEGYDLQVAGTLRVDVAVPTEQTSWSGVKALFN
jgi:hypothetical protein